MGWEYRQQSGGTHVFTGKPYPEFDMIVLMLESGAWVWAKADFVFGPMSVAIELRHLSSFPETISFFRNARERLWLEHKDAK